jgi:hypothetical protein
LTVGAALAVGPIFLVQALFAGKSDLGSWDRIGVVLMITGVISLAAGVGLALWRLIQNWAYDRYTDGSFR